MHIIYRNNGTKPPQRLGRLQRQGYEEILWISM